MTAETIHTCSYSCERPECIRAQRDELVSRLTEQQPEARGVVDEVIGKLPADLTHSQAWPQDYVNGWNEALRLVREELPAALAEARNVR